MSDWRDKFKGRSYESLHYEAVNEYSLANRDDWCAAIGKDGRVSKYGSYNSDPPSPDAYLWLLGMAESGSYEHQLWLRVAELIADRVKQEPDFRAKF